MPEKSDTLATLPKRLKEARVQKGLSQRQLGIAAGLDTFVASARINRYERGVHQPDPLTVQRMSRALGVPASYLYADDDLLARLILAFNALPRKVQERVVAQLECGTEVPVNKATHPSGRRSKDHA